MLYLEFVSLEMLVIPRCTTKGVHPKHAVLYYIYLKECIRRL